MKKKNGFTLVELVIVIGVIAILTAVLIPTFAGIIGKAKESTIYKRALWARDEYVSGSAEVLTPEDMEGYIIGVDEHYYEVTSDGSLTVVDFETLTSADINLNYNKQTNIKLGGADVYKSESTGGYVNGEFVSWSTLLENNLVVVNELDLRQLEATMFNGTMPELIEEFNAMGLPATSSLKCITYYDSSITKLVFGGNQAKVVINMSVYSVFTDYLHYTWYRAFGDFADDYDFSSSENNTLEEIVMLDGVEYLTPLAFVSCTALHTVTIPDSMTVMGMSAFMLCTSLENVLINETSNLKLIDNAAFLGCTSLTHIYIPQGVTEIRYYAFIECGFTSFIIPDNITRLDYTCFKGCANLTTIVIPATVTIIQQKIVENTDLQTVYYTGTSSEYSSISINEDGNNLLNSAQKYYAGEWHLENGVPTLD